MAHGNRMGISGSLGNCGNKGRSDPNDSVKVQRNSDNTIPIEYNRLDMYNNFHDYRLAWLICHEGQHTKSGHYICYLPMIEENSFLKMNNNKITTVQLSEKLM